MIATSNTSSVSWFRVQRCLHPKERARGHFITHLDTRNLDLAKMRKHFTIDKHMDTDSPAMDDQTFVEVLADTVAEFFADREDVGADCPNRGPFLKVVDCEIGCQASRKALPTFACRKHGECSQYKYQFNQKTFDCVSCIASEVDA